MKLLLRLLPLILGLTILVGCAVPVAAPATVPTAAETPASAVAATGETRLITHAMGETAVPVDPQRVVVLDTGELDAALALGVKPVGSVTRFDDGLFPHYLADQTAGIEAVGTIGTPNLEQIVALTPDLILSNQSRDEERYDLLTAIAPTIFAERLGPVWKENFQLYAETLNKTAEAEAVVAAYDARLAELRAALGDEELTVSMVRFVDGQVRVYHPGSFIGVILADAGLQRPATQQSPDEVWSELSQELIPQLDADVIFYGVYGDPAVTPLDTFLNDPLWSQLSAVQNGRVFAVPDEYWYAGLGFLAANRVVDDLFTYLAPDAATAPSAPASDPNACRTIIHDMGETEVCGTPTKVVVLGPHMLDILLSLGLQATGFAETSQINEEEFGKPVGTIAYLGPYVTEMPINVGSREEPNLEVLTLLKPDLILSELRDEAQLALLQQIAPTLAYRGNRAAEWQRTIVPIAAALNIPAEAQRVIDEYKAFVAEKRAELAPLIAAYPRLIFMPRNQDGRITIFTPNSWAGELLVSLGFDLIYVADEAEVDTEVSVELMPTFSTDTIILGASGTTTPAIAQEMWNSNAVLAALPASTAGRVYFVDYQLWSRLRGPLAARLVTEEVIRLFTPQ